MGDATSIKIKYKLPQSYVVLVFEKVPGHFWRIAIVTKVLPRRDFETKYKLNINIMTLTKQIRQGNKC